MKEAVRHLVVVVVVVVAVVTSDDPSERPVDSSWAEKRLDGQDLGSCEYRDLNFPVEVRY